MLPYWHYLTYSIGPLTLQTWGTFVSLGILVGLLIVRRGARRKGIDPKPILDAAVLMIIAAFVGARLGHVFLYEWAYYREHLDEIWKIWLGGYSSYGGFLAAITVGVILFKKIRITQLPNYPITRITDILISGFPLGWAIGRIGCFLIHDHPGTLTSFILGVQYPDGTRHDLGLYDGLNTLGLAILLLIIGRRLEKRPGLLTATVALWYGIVRFFLDFLRAYDARYLGLTPAQYGSLALVVFGTASLIYLWHPSTRLHSSPA